MKIISINNSVSSKNNNESFGCKYCDAIREMLVYKKNLVTKEIVDKFINKNLGDLTERGIELGPHKLGGGNLISRGSLLVGDSTSLAKTHSDKAYKLFTALKDMHNDKEIIDIVLKDIKLNLS